MTKARRTGRIFVDYLRNGRGATSVAPYSARARKGAPISMPLAWRQLKTLTSPAEYTVRSELSKRDAWAAFFDESKQLV